MGWCWLMSLSLIWVCVWWWWCCGSACLVAGKIDEGKSRPFSPFFIFFLSFSFLKLCFWGIKGWDICPSINQNPTRATLCTENPGDPPASISSEVLPAVHTARAAAVAAPRLLRRYPLAGGELGFANLRVFLFLLFYFFGLWWIEGIWDFEFFFFDHFVFSVELWCFQWEVV